MNLGIKGRENLKDAFENIKKYFLINWKEFFYLLSEYTFLCYSRGELRPGIEPWTSQLSASCHSNELQRPVANQKLEMCKLQGGMIWLAKE